MKMQFSIDTIYEETFSWMLEKNKHYTMCEVPDQEGWYYQISICKLEKKNSVYVTLHYAWKRWLPDGRTYITAVPDTDTIFNIQVNIDKWDEVRGMAIAGAYNVADVLYEKSSIKRQVQESVAR